MARPILTAILLCPLAFPQTKPAPQPAAAQPTQGVAQIQDLLDALARFDRNGRNPKQKLGFELPEKAVNEYIAFALRRSPRPGLSAAAVTLAGRNEVAASIELDFDAIRNWSLELIPESLRPAWKGRKMLRLTAQFESENGTLSFTVKEGRPEDGGAPLPASFIKGILQALGQRQPEAWDTSKPIPLPFGIKRVWIDRHALCGET